MIVDTHIHWSPANEGGAAAFLGILDRYGIGHAVVCGFEVLWKIGTASDWNTRLAELCREDRARLTPLGTVHLAEEHAALDEARRCLDELGMAGFKVHPWVQGETMFCDTMDGLCTLAGRAGVPLMFHDGTPAYAMSSQVGVLAARFPGTTFVLGHGGILHFWEEAVDVALQFENVYITLCGQHPWAMQAVCDRVDPARILWGSDFVGPGAEEYIVYRKGLAEHLRLSDELRDKVMGANAQRLYRIRS